MTTEFKLPELGEDIETGDIINIMVTVGDSVTKEQPLMEIETDKAVIELPAPIDGSIKELHVKKGDNIKIGQLLVTFDEISSDLNKEEQDLNLTKIKQDQVKNDTVKITGEKENEHDESTPVTSETEEEGKVISMSRPEEKPNDGIEIEKKLGSDQDNIISISRQEEVESNDDNKIEIIPASPSIRRLAREIGVDLKRVKGSGTGGRITQEDVKEYSRNSLTNKKEYKADNKSDAGLKEIESRKDKDIVIEPMNRVRIIIADRLSDSWKAPHVTQHDKADITEIEQFRKDYGEEVKKAGGKLTMTSIITKIVSHALIKFPKFNCSIDMDRKEIIYKNFYNIGIAVDTDRGLLVPVIKDVNKKNIVDISKELTDLSERSRNKKVSIDELQGSTFTISNLGGLGGTYFTPVIYSPNVAILGMSRSNFEPVYINEDFVPRLMLPFSLSYDHRIIDGADAVRFLRWIIEALEKPFKILLNS